MKKFILLAIALISILDLNAKTPLMYSDDEYNCELFSSIDPTISIFPNPTNSDATLNITLPKAAAVSYSVSNSLGQQIEADNLGTLKVGSYSIKLNSTEYSNGIYFKSSVSSSYLSKFDQIVFDREITKLDEPSDDEKNRIKYHLDEQSEIISTSSNFFPPI